MATGTAHSQTPAQTVQPGYDHVIESQLARTGWQVKTVDLIGSAMLYAIAAVLFFLFVAVVDHWIFGLGFWGRLFAFFTFFGGTIWFISLQVMKGLQTINPVYAAKVIEQGTPSLKNSLVNMLMFRPSSTPIHQMMVQALRQKAAADLSHVSVDSMVDRTQLIKLGYVLAAALAICASYKIISPKDPLQTVSRVIAPWADIARPSRVQIVDIEPGDASVIHGQSVKISAKINVVGMSSPGLVTLYYSTADGQTIERPVPMTVASDSTRHECQLPPGGSGIQQDLTYYIVAGDAISPKFRLAVLPAPTILVERLEYAFPSYTAKPKQIVERQGDINALEGTKVTVVAKANQPIKSAYIEFDPPTAAQAAKHGSTAQPVARAEVVPMKFEGDSATATILLELAADKRTPKRSSYQVRFVTQDDQRNEPPIRHQIQVIPDLGPEIEILTPTQDRVNVPVNGRQKIEVRAVDPDYGVSKITLRAVAGGNDVLTKDLLHEPKGRAGQTVVAYDFVPSELHLKAGDEVTYWANVDDNRTAPLSGLPEPNSQRTRNFVIRVVAADESTKPGDNNDPRNSPRNDERPDAKDNTQPAADPKQADSKQPKEAPNKPTPDKPNQGQNESQEKPADSKNPKDSNQKNQDDKGQPGSKSQDNKSQGSSKSNEKSGEKSENNSGGGKPEPSQGDPQGDKKDGQGQGTKENTSNDSQSQNNPNSGTSGGKPSNNPNPNQNPQQNQPGSKSESNPPNPNGNQQGEPAGEGTGREGAEPKQPGATRRNSDGSPTGEPGRREKPHDGEVIEKALEHLREQQKQKDAENDPAQSKDKDNGANASPKKEGDPNNGQPTGQQPKANDPQSGGKPADQPSGDKPKDQPGNNADPNAGKQPMNSGEGGDKPGSAQKSDGTSDKTKSPSTDPNKKPGQEGGSGSPEKSPTKNDNAGGQPKNPSGKPDQNPAGSDPKNDEKNPGQGDSGQSGSAQKETQNKKNQNSSAPPAQGKNRDRDKKDDGGGNQPKDSADASSPSTSNRQSDSKSDSQGDQSGGGGKGGGQSGNKQGNDSAGKNSPADEGANQANEKGKGEDSQRAGDQKQAQQKTGQAGNEKGTGSGSAPSENGQEKTDKPPQNASTNKTPGAGNGVPNGGGVPGENQTGNSNNAAVPDGDAANLEYARKATDLALEHLKNQKDNPDRELLEKLGWTKEELQQFLQRWEAMKRDATKSKTDETSRELEDALRSLGLRPQRDKKRAAGVTNDAQRGNRDAGNRSAPPATYQEQFNAFRKGTARSSGEKD